MDILERRFREIGSLTFQIFFPQMSVSSILLSHTQSKSLLPLLRLYCILSRHPHPASSRKTLPRHDFFRHFTSRPHRRPPPPYSFVHIQRPVHTNGSSQNASLAPGPRINSYRLSRHRRPLSLPRPRASPHTTLRLDLPQPPGRLRDSLSRHRHDPRHGPPPSRRLAPCGSVCALRGRRLRKKWR